MLLARARGPCARRPLPMILAGTAPGTTAAEGDDDRARRRPRRAVPLPPDVVHGAHARAGHRRRQRRLPAVGRPDPRGDRRAAGVRDVPAGAGQPRRGRRPAGAEVVGAGARHRPPRHDADPEVRHPRARRAARGAVLVAHPRAGPGAGRPDPLPAAARRGRHRVRARAGGPALGGRARARRCGAGSRRPRPTCTPGPRSWRRRCSSATGPASGWPASARSPCCWPRPTLSRR